MNTDEKPLAEQRPALPVAARLPINRCNLPAVILGGPTYQAHPVPLEIDGINDFHRDLFTALDAIPTPMARAERFIDYMTVRFCLEDLEEAGLTPGRRKKYRSNANYLRMVRGWSFDSDGREGAVLKHWVETRFGLLARYHGGALDGRDSDAYYHYLLQGSQGLYATNALEAQLDLLYTFCQYELARQQPAITHFTLYRGINRIDEHEVLMSSAAGQYRVLFNNLNSFTSCRERADEFGDYILSVAVPTPKVLFYNRLLPGMLKGEDEYVVIGGVYDVVINTL
ncbi:NAD(+)--dinitrogen-reductase ADP-D-ribosyltransferase [Thiospirillum jenense]|uniref:NAD(+)--dinitrogen-reductase ADP-D-ribosyltransferase n=1 Tax=Thiospirillum jenense TaxID=1653858 RepID=A0A839HEX9_9GAMM|nr:NAD(+)--dinitrogen-reductase ADP-D-ribosyltransferase [Thiospirillum jenense]MBB1126670.1 NAD(+)--dinitrogen-reductase ADP-D-ribosyltransferase [Thiospirillum jenense]